LKSASSIYGLPLISPGGQNLELNGYTWGTVSYTVTGLTVGERYDLSWDYGGRPGSGPSAATTSFGGVDLVTNTGSFGKWTHNLFSVVATSTSETLTFAAAATGSSTAGNEYTNVSLSAPEPSTWAMMGIGFAMLAFAGYRSRRPAAIA
jgi:hypothetical protein